jgi:tripartite-type tricarboxylate transporter receptor subunit TctC
MTPQDPTRRRPWLGACALAALATLAPSAWSQPDKAADWPSKPVRLVVPAAAGTAPDIMARLLGERLSKIWGQPVIIDNKPGAGGVIGMTAIKNAERDSHAFAFVPASVITLTPYMYRPTTVDMARDFTAVGMVAIGPMLAAVRADSPANTLAEVIQEARRNPDKFVVATTFQYSVPHLTAELLSKAAGVPLRAVPFTASGQSISAVMNGDAQLVLDGIPPLEAMVKGGRLKAIAAFSEERLPKRGQLPTVAETYPGLVVNGWFGVLAPTGTQVRAIERFNKDLATVLAQPDVIERLDGFGVYPKPMAPAQFADFWNKERQRWEQVLRDVNAQPVQQ